MGVREVMNHAIFPWLSGFGNQRKGQRLEGADKGLKISLCKGANVSSFPKLVPHNLIVNIKVLKNRWVIRRDMF